MNITTEKYCVVSGMHASHSKDIQDSDCLDNSSCMIKINFDFFIDSFESQIMEIDKSGPITVLTQVY